MAWIVADTTGSIYSKKKYIIRPEDFEIPDGATSVHGISNECAIKNGTELATVLNEFFLDLCQCHSIVGHNVIFDAKVIGAEMIRIGKGDFMEQIPSYCTMRQSTNFCQIHQNYGGKTSMSYKWPKLSELYLKLFNHNFENAHDAMSDITATMKCYYQLVEKKIIIYDFQQDDIKSNYDRYKENSNIKDKEFWEKCKSSKNYKEYINNYPLGLFIKEALDALEEFDWENCKTATDVKEYKVKYPQGKYKYLIDSTIDFLTWKQANGLKDYKKYLSEFPSGTYRKKAKIKIIKSILLRVSVVIILLLILIYLLGN